MNNKLLLSLVVSVAVLAGAGCNKSGKLDTPSQFQTPTGPVELKLKWPTGERVVQNLDMKQTAIINVPGQPAPMNQSTTMGQKYALTVLNQDAAGGHELEMEFLSARMATEMGGKTQMSYDSEKAAPADKKNPVAGVFNKIVGSKIRFFLDASNNVERLEGINDLANRLSSGSQNAAAASLKSMFTESYFKQVMSGNQFLPNKAVQPGDTWPVAMDFPGTGMGKLTVNYNVTLKSWELHGKRNCARLEFDGSIQLKSDANTSLAGIKLSIPEGNTTGISWFDPELGIVIDSTMDQELTLLMTLPANPRVRGPAAQGMTMTNQVSQKLNIKLDSVK